ncbi:MAG: hypothetical protein H6713_23765 [Myxococcales bacterium]|nr:hypothetical protein [Myxococcales bacterium]
MRLSRLRTLALRLGLSPEGARAELEARVFTRLPSAIDQLARSRPRLDDVQRVIDFLIGDWRMNAARRRRGVELLLRMLAIPRIEAQQRVIAGLERLPHAELEGALAVALASVDGGRRRLAMRAYVARVGPRGRERVIAGLADPEPAVAREAIEALIRWRVDINLDALTRLRARPEPELARLIERLLLLNDDANTIARHLLSSDVALRQAAEREITRKVEAALAGPRPIPRALLPAWSPANRLAIALWSATPIGWSVPAELARRETKAARKLAARLMTLCTQYHRGALVSLLWRARRARRGRPV